MHQILRNDFLRAVVALWRSSGKALKLSLKQIRFITNYRRFTTPPSSHEEEEDKPRRTGDVSYFNVQSGESGKKLYYN